MNSIALLGILLGADLGRRIKVPCPDQGKPNEV